MKKIKKNKVMTCSQNVRRASSKKKPHLSLCKNIARCSVQTSFLLRLRKSPAFAMIFS
jgi:hypothetical protein